MRRTRPGGTPNRATTGRDAAALLAVLALLAAATAVAVSGAWASWSISGAGSASASAGTLPAPSGVTGSSVPGSGVVSVAWAGVTAPDGGAVDGYVVERLQGASASPACGSSPASPLPGTAASCSDTVATAGIYTYRVTAAFRSWSARSAESADVTVILDITPPTAVSVARAAASPAPGPSVSWTITFDEPVTGVDAGDLALVQSGGLVGASLTGVTGSGATWTATASVGGPAGTLRLDLVDDDSILDGAGNRLGGFGAGNGSLTGQAYAIDTSAPSAPSLTLSDVTGNTYVAGTTAWINPQPGRSGSFRVTAATADADSGVASVSFPTPGSFTGGGAVTTAPYRADYAWANAPAAAGAGTHTVTATNGAGSTSSSSFTVVADTAAPTGGSLTVNGGGPYSAVGQVAVASSGFGDTGAGILANEVTREFAGISGDACGVYAGLTTVPGNATDTGLVTGCYRYVLTASDRVGNSASTAPVTVKVDTTAPAVPALTVSGATAGVTFVSGTTVYVRAGQPGQVTLSATAADADTGIAAVTFPTFVGTTGGGPDTAAPYATTYDWAGPFTGAATTVSATNLAGGTSPTAALSLVQDGTAPTGGSLTVNGGGMYATSLTIPLSVAAYAEVASASESGLATSLLTRQRADLVGDACGAYGAPATIPGGASDTVPSAGCYLYTLTGVDNVGNTASLQRTVKIDTTAPTTAAAALSAATGNTFLSGTIAFVSALAGRTGSFTVTASGTDAETGIASATLPTLTGFLSGGGLVPAPGLATTYTWSGTGAASAAGAKSITVTNAAGLARTQASAFSVVNDTTAPTGGALTVNGTAGSGGGSTSSSRTGTYALARTDYAETASATASGLASSLLTRAVGTSPTSGACASYGTPAAFTGTSETGLALGCYRYVLTGTDNVGNAASLTTTVVVAPVRITSITAATGTAVTISGTALWGGGNVRVVVCRTNTAPTCTAANRAYRNTSVGVGASYTWTVTTTNLSGTTFYVFATQSTTTGPTVTIPPLPYTAP